MDFVISGDSKWYNLGKQFGNIAKIKIVRHLDPEILLVGVNSSHLPTFCVQRYMYKIFAKELWWQI